MQAVWAGRRRGRGAAHLWRTRGSIRGRAGDGETGGCASGAWSDGALGWSMQPTRIGKMTSTFRVPGQHPVQMVGKRLPVALAQRRWSSRVYPAGRCGLHDAARLREHPRPHRRAPEPRPHPRRPRHLRLGQSLRHTVLRFADRGGGVRQRSSGVPGDDRQRHRDIRRLQCSRIARAPGRGGAGGGGKRHACGARPGRDRHSAGGQADDARGVASRGVSSEHRRRNSVPLRQQD